MRKLGYTFDGDKLDPVLKQIYVLISSEFQALDAKEIKKASKKKGR